MGHIVVSPDNKRAVDNRFPNGEGFVPPFKLTPVYRDYLWGGAKLKTEYGKRTPLEVVAESWELSAHKAGRSTISDGSFKGAFFDEFIKAHPKTCGTRCAGDRFPLLVKLIDSRQDLSIQVHPDDDYAYSVEGEPGKTEMWVILEHEPAAFLYLGFKSEISREEYADRIQNGTLTQILNKVPVHRGDVFFIPAGTIHAIGAGITLVEIQQNSDSTYRVFDFGRLGADGKPRALHIEKALDVTLTCPVSFAPPGAGLLEENSDFRLERLACCRKFSAERLTLNKNYTRNMAPDSFLSVLCTEGSASLTAEGDSIRLFKGDCAFVPAGSYSFTLSGAGQMLFAGLSPPATRDERT